MAATLALILPAGCKDEKKAPPPAPAAADDRIRDATEQALRAGGPVKMQFRGVQVYAQAMPDRMAVCGLLDPFADDPDIYVPFVSIVSVPPTQADQTPQYGFEHHIGKTTSEASHVYVAIVDYCWDKGGPAPGPYHSVMSTPPLPDAIPDPSKPRLTIQARGPTAPAAAAAPVADQVPASGTVVVRQAANVHSDPHGPSVRVVAQGTSLHVFAQSSGGWYQVGDTAPWGWVHESMLDKH